MPPAKRPIRNPVRTTAPRPAGSAAGAPQRRPPPAPAPPPTRPPLPWWSNKGVAGPTQAGPAPAGATKPKTPGVLSTPGHYEKWWEQNQRAPGADYTSDYWSRISGQMSGPAYQPTNARGAYGYMSDVYGRPSQGQNNARDISEQVRGPGAGDPYMRGAGDIFGAPTMAGGYAERALGSGYFDTPGSLEDYAAGLKGRFDGPGRGESGAYGIAENPLYGEEHLGWLDEQLRGSNYGDDALAMMLGLKDNERTGDYFASDIKPASRRNTTEEERGYFAEDLRAPSYSEDLYASGNEGLNYFYDRERDKRQQRLEDQMAAMGVFGSGETARSMFELEGELGAAQARDMADLAAQADEAFLGRTGAAQAFASSAGEEELGRKGLGLQGAKLSDENTRANALAMLEGYEFASDEEMAKMQERRLAADMASRNAIARGQLGLDADKTGLERYKTGADIFGAADESGRERFRTGSEIARTGDESRFEGARGLFDVGAGMSREERERFGLSGDLGLRADEEERMRIGELFRSGQQLDETEMQALRDWLERQRLGLETTQGLDEFGLKRWETEGAAARTAQEMFETRERYGIQDKMALASQKAGLVERFTRAATDEQRELVLAEIQNLVASGAIDAKTAEQWIEEMYEAAGNVVKAGENQREGGT